ncbi:MAG: Smr/MutS family protein [Pseudorhodoplanes sp.]
MSGKRRGLSEEDRALWRGVTRSVSPLRRSRRAKEPETEKANEEENVPRKSVAASKTGTRTMAPAAPPSPPAKALPALTSLDRRARQRIARGQQAIDARIDLHGHTLASAYDALSRFLHRAQADGGKVALVITGKGTFGGRERGVLKRQVPMWLGAPEFRGIVVGFENASIGHGGAGALYVRLRRKR